MSKTKQNSFSMIFHFVLITFLCSICVAGYSQDVRINEFMALNQTTLTDEDGEYSDWLELYNVSGSAIDLQGWSLTDDPTDPLKWIIPDITLNADEYLIVFASGKDRNVSGSELHTSFKLSGSGEYLALRNAVGTIVTEFSPSFPPQQSDYSYGYSEGSWIEYSDPTPGEDNSVSTGTVIPPPQVNVPHGLFDTPFNLVLTSSFSGASIYYTTDGSVPGTSNGTLYSAPINISTTSVIRAVAIVAGESPSQITTQSYIFPSDVINQDNAPEGYPDMWGPYTAIAGTAIADYEMDPEMIADPEFANAVEASLNALPVISLVTNKDHFFSHSTDPDVGGIYIYTGPPASGTTYDLGRGWERPVSFEYFDSESGSMQVDCGVSLHGGHSRRPEKSPKHSLLLEFKSEFGPTRLNYAFFGEEGSGNYNKLILRSGFGNSWIHHSNDERQRSAWQRDIWTKDAQRAMGHPSSNSIYVHLYINGIYWGIYAPSERMDSDFGEKYLGGDAEEYDVIKDYTEVANGNNDAWNQMMDLANAGLITREAYMQIQGKLPDGTPDPDNKPLLDVVNLADYMLVNFYGSNTDWDHHNWAAMRNRVDPGNGFKFLCWDSEHMIKSVSGNNLSENNAGCPSRVFSQLKQNDDFKRLFADRIQKHCLGGGALTPEKALARWNERRAQVEPGVRAESARWGDYRRDVHQFQTAGPFYLYTYDDHYLTQQDFMTNTYFPQRTDVFLDQLRAAGLFPGVDAPVFYLNDNPVFSDIISTGDELSMTASEGTIYYTTNGTDPVNWNPSDDDNSLVLISEEDDKRVFVPKSDIGDTWYTNNLFDDYEWLLCTGDPGGIGYEKNSGYEELISLDVANDMHDDGGNPNTSCYVRIPFNVTAAELSEITFLLLSIDYDDGFVAYLNGTIVAERNTPASVSWNSIAPANHEAGTPEQINISDNISLLVAGENILAIHGINQSTSSSDFLILPSLIASDQQLEGNITDDASIYSGPVDIGQSSHVIARAFHNGEWSASTDRYFIIPADYQDLKITEIHYNPLGSDTIDGGQFEFIEIKNTGIATLNLGGVGFTNGIDYTFLPETQLRPAEFAVLASNNLQFTDRYNLVPSGEYDGKLDNNGERIVFVDFLGDTIINIRYEDDDGWPREADGGGTSLVPVDLNPVTDQTLYTDWRISYHVGGSPGEDDLPPNVIEPITLNAEESSYVLAQNYPNPFQDITYIDYLLEEEATIRLDVYNVMGQLITTLVNSHHTKGHYQTSWDGYDSAGNSIPNGMYIYRMSIQGKNRQEVQSRKLMLIR